MPEHGDWHTLAYRCYLPFRGKRLMREFVGRVIEEYIRHIPTARVWVIINNENKASEALATHLGFTAVNSLSLPEEHLLVMRKK
jgi:RimJ/RimL family protein N-acetyltransferase